jgi:hypothetical protein
MLTDKPPLAAPDHWVRQLTLATLPPLNPLGGPPEEQRARHEATIRRYLDTVWGDAFHAGAAWWAARERPVPIPMVLPPDCAPNVDR